jgi:hypothetical protein
MTIYLADDIERHLLESIVLDQPLAAPQGYEQNFRNAAVVQSVTRGGQRLRGRRIITAM